jgi:hypothetical protein
MLMGRETAGDWFILRTAGRSTLPLASSLAEDGFEVWTPVHKVRLRVPRMNVKREVTLPLLKEFIFVRSGHLDDLLALSKLQLKPRRIVKPIIRGEPNDPRYHRDFSVFRPLGEIIFIADHELNPLREEEAARVPKTIVKKKRGGPHFEPGTRIGVTTGVYQGLRGRVQRCRSGYALVVFDDWKRPAKIPTFLLREVDIPSAHHQSARAA